MVGISIRENIGLGDKLQFSSLPENYFRATGKRLFDTSRAWIFDHNPYVIRDTKELRGEIVSGVRELWNFPQIEAWANPRVYKTDPAVYLSNAEVTASRFKVPVVLNRPRLYRFEHYPFELRTAILFHTNGRSHGQMPDNIVEHVIKKYKGTGQLFHIGLKTDPNFGIPKIETPTIWDLVEVISKARMLIGVDSGPTWIGACFPDVVVKKVRLRQVHGQKAMKDWVPLEIANLHSHWDDRLFQIHNPSEDDVGAFPSYKRL